MTIQGIPNGDELFAPDAFPSVDLSAPTDCAFVHESLTGLQIVHVYGDVDLSSSPAFESAIAEAAQMQAPIVINLEPCNYVDSSVLSALIRLHKTYGDRLWIVLPKSSPVRRIFAITSLLLALPIIETITDIHSHRP